MLNSLILNHKIFISIYLGDTISKDFNIFCFFIKYVQLETNVFLSEVVYNKGSRFCYTQNKIPAAFDK